MAKEKSASLLKKVINPVSYVLEKSIEPIKDFEGFSWGKGVLKRNIMKSFNIFKL